MVRSVVLAVRVKPGASRARVGGRHDGPHGPALVVAVTARAVDGRATEAARLAVADALGLRHRAVALRAGAASRDKLFTVTLPDDLSDAAARDRVTALLDTT
ncbi:DUF167 domain-containing protein [Asanoa sp. WMMD1127]|uniref:DUF167 domain-containing protein n=1 Tax=Asanoa sp. WMMD1127 TaxID=3016107 RepID=UPI0024178F99|nr:DUF167 domain-containing protein [Asanoa sp. WMMD1127]MDG4827065.1 DUF167 domain-containing protein [Asanoa sp. WMMD1127]